MDVTMAEVRRAALQRWPRRRTCSPPPLLTAAAATPAPSTLPACARAPQPISSLASQQGGEDPLSLPPHGTEVFVGGLPKTLGEQQLRDFASEAGDVHSAKLIRDPNNPSQNRGYGFVK